MRRFPPVLGMLLLLVLAYVLDRMIEGARNAATARLSVAGYQWLVLFANLMFAAGVLGVGWLLQGDRGRSRWQAALFLIVGLAIILLPTPPFWLVGADFSGPLFSVLQASPHSLFGEAGAFLTVMGLAAILLPLPGAGRNATS
jgi:hypothetical protein